MNGLRHYLYQSSVAKYTKFRSRLDRNIATGRFKKFARRKQRQLVQRLERLRRQVLQWQTQLKLAGAGAALSLFLQASPAEAQTTIGPFVRNYKDNPLRPPLPFIDQPNPVFVDMDGDGDKDLVIGKGSNYFEELRYFENVGTSTSAIFNEISQYDPGYPFSNVLSAIPNSKSSFVPAFADIDDDGDLDLLIGTDEFKYGYSYGHTYFFSNEGSASTPNFQNVTGSANPFDGFQSKRKAHPTFVDMDKDGDMDLVLGGYYASSSYNYLVQFFENQGTTTAPVFVNTSSAFPRPYMTKSYVVNNVYGSFSSPLSSLPIQLADLDEDGDMDFFFSLYGQIIYLRNQDGTFISNNSYSYPNDPTQSGPWVPDTNNPGGSLGNPFFDINENEPATSNDYTTFSFVDLDDDGDMDVIMGYAISSYDDRTRSLFYYENKGQGVFEGKVGLDSPIDGVDLGNSSNSSIVDFDKDGDLDILATGLNLEYAGNENYYDLPTIEFYENDGQNKFSKQLPNISFETNLPEFANLKFIDLDQNGDYDLAVTNYDEILYFQNEYGTFIEVTGSENPFSFVSGNAIASFDLGDMDGDGDLDFVISKTNSSDLELYENSDGGANPIFVRRTDWEGGLSNSGLFFGANIKLLDVDHDADLDIVSGKYNSVWYFENIGSGNKPEFVVYRDINYEENNLVTRLAINNPFKDIQNDRRIVPNFLDVDLDGDQDFIFGDYEGIFSFYENQNPSPQLTIKTSANYPGGQILTIDPTLTLSDADGDLISQVIITLFGIKSTETIQIGTLPATIQSTFQKIGNDGVLTLTGPASIADFQAALRTLRYNDTSLSGGRTKAATPTQSALRTISIEVLDADFTSNSSNNRTVVINASAAPPPPPSNIAPDLAIGTTTITYSGTPIPVASDVVVNDSDNHLISQATLTIVSNFVSGEDELLFTNQNGITGAFDATTGVLTLTGSTTTTDADFQTALRSVSYRNNAADRTNADRSVVLLVNDGSGDSNLLTVAVQVPNVAPQLLLAGATLTFSGEDIVIDNSVVLTDADDLNLKGATVSISSGYSTGEDQLVFVNQNGITGTFNAAVGRLTLTGTASVANYQTALRSIAYQNTAADRKNQNRTISFTVTDGLLTSAASNITLAVPNQAPALALTISAANYAGIDLLLDGNLTLTDADDTNLLSASVLFTTGFVSSEDILVFTNQNGITGNFNSSSGTLSLSGSATIANYQSALRSIIYRNGSGNRTSGSRQLTIQVNDGQVTSNAGSIALSVVNTAPGINSSNVSVFYGSTDLVIDNNLVLSDQDNTDLTGATVKITTGIQSDQDVLLFANQNGITGVFTAATGSLVLSGASSLANYQQALRSVLYRNTSATPNTADRTVTFAVTDGGNTSNITSTIVKINQPPQINAAPQAIAAGGNVGLAIIDILSDPDNNLDVTSLVVTSGVGALVSITNGQVLVDYSNVADFKGTDVLTITVCDLAGRCQTKTVDISLEANVIVYNGVSPNGDTANDYFKIRFLPPGSKVSIYNRWGDLVFEMLDYKSDVPGKRFEGFNNNGNELASGTYFYKIGTPDGNSITGYLTLKR